MYHTNSFLLTSHETSRTRLSRLVIRTDISRSSKKDSGLISTYSYFVSVPGGGVCSVPRYRHIDLREGINLADHWMVGWLGFRANVDVIGKLSDSCLLRE